MAEPKPSKHKAGAVNPKRAASKSDNTPALTPHQKAAATRARKKAEAEALAKAEAQRLAQVVNLHIAGYSLADIGAAIGASEAEVDRMLNRDAARYVKSQPQLRVYVRNWVSERYTKMLDTVWDDATDKASPRLFDAQDRALRILNSMTKLHGAEAPAQSEVKVEAAPEAVEQLVTALAAQQGLAYDTSIFDDVVDAEVVHDAVAQSEEATLDAAERVGEPVDGENEEL